MLRVSLCFPCLRKDYHEKAILYYTSLILMSINKKYGGLRNMEMSSLTKLIVCVLVILSATILCALGQMPYAETGVLISGALGYVFGNGHGIMSARNGGANNGIKR